MNTSKFDAAKYGAFLRSKIPPSIPLWKQARLCEFCGARPDLPTCFYIDLALPWRKIAIEVDGGSHRMLEWKKRDTKKTAFLESLGWTVLRFWNKEILSWKDLGMPADSRISTILQQHSIPHFG